MNKKGTTDEAVARLRRVWTRGQECPQLECGHLGMRPRGSNHEFLYCLECSTLRRVKSGELVFIK